MRVVFAAVNYRTSALIAPWQASVRALCPEAEMVIVDNYADAPERAAVREQSRALGIDLIEADNTGYGSALNRIWAHLEGLAPGDLVVMGNLDMTYGGALPQPGTAPQIFAPVVQEGARDRNIFLTRAQRRLYGIYDLALWTRSRAVLYGIAALLKPLGWLPGRPWAVHGSVFCFNGAAWQQGAQVFNPDSFLYCEELEFGSWAEAKGIAIQRAPAFVCTHTAHGATGQKSDALRRYFEHWLISYGNWRQRWR